MRNKEDEPEQTVTDQAGEPSSAYLRRNVAEDKPERMGVAGEGPHVDRRAPQRRHIQHPAGGLMQKHRRGCQGYKRPYGPPVASRRLPRPLPGTIFPCRLLFHAHLSLPLLALASRRGRTRREDRRRPLTIRTLRSVMR